MSSTRTISTYQDAVEFLFGRINYERTAPIPRMLKLERMWALAERVGNPQAGLPVVHVAGSKGKGSTARFIAEILRAAGYRTGLYTSPHLEHVEERIWMNGDICSPETFTQLTQRLVPAVLELDAELGGHEQGPTYFEIMTAMAMLHFHTEQVDFAVLEVGLGGRLDSTNICEPICCVISSISLDHTAQLGDDLPSIAAEKAGIIKSGVPVVSGVQDQEAARVIQQFAAGRAAQLFQLGTDFFVQHQPAESQEASRYQRFDVQLLENSWGEIPTLRTPMLGPHQAINAALAVATCDILNRTGYRVGVSAVQRGVETTRLPGRIELVGSDPPVILDTAHNEASMRAMIRAIDQRWPALAKTVIFGTTRGKPAAQMMEMLAHWADKLILTPYLTNPRSYQTDELIDALLEVLPNPPVDLFIAENPLAAWQQAQQHSHEMICVTGSFFLAGELRGTLVPSRHPPEVV